MTDLISIPALSIDAELYRRRDFDFITVTDVSACCRQKIDEHNICAKCKLPSTPISVKHIKQEAALQILTDNNTVEFVYGGAAGGAKSWTGCAWLLFNSICYPGTKWFIGREELKRLRESTFQTFLTAAKHYQVVINEDFTYNGQDHYFQFANGSRIDLLDVKYLPSDPLYERYGSIEYTGGWLEEGGEIHVLAYDVLKSRIGRRHNDKYNLLSKLFITCNPKKNWLYHKFWKPYKAGQLLKYQQFLQAFVDDNVFGESGYKDRLQSIDDPANRARLLEGFWEYDDDPAQLMDFDSISDLFNNYHLQGGDRYITADIARFGADRTVIILWSGWIAEKIWILHGKGIADVADEIREMMKQYSVPPSSVIVDDDGVGGGVKDILRCKGFVNNSRPVEIFNIGKEMYRNLKSQCYFRIADRVMKRGVWVKTNVPKIKADLTEELEQVKQLEMDSDKPKSVIPKDDVKATLGRSPDISDALMMREYFELQPKPKPRVTAA